MPTPAFVQTHRVGNRFVRNPVDAGSARRRGRRSIRAFSLVELLVVITIISTLMGLLLPAVQAAREASRRGSCMNNLKQIATAMTSYESGSRSLPGWRNNVGKYSTGTGTPTTSWTVPILPQMGNTEAFKWFDEYTADSDDITKKSFPFYICPSAPGVLASPSKAALCYVVNGGTGAEELKGSTTPATPARQYGFDGVFVDAVGGAAYEAGRTSLNTSNDSSGDGTTIMLAERCGRNLMKSAKPMTWEASPLMTSGSGSAAKPDNHIFMLPPKLTSVTGTSSTATYPGGYALYKLINTNSTEAPASGDVAILSGEEDEWMYRYPSSTHSGEGVIAAFCDGHTMFLSSKISPWAYSQLMTAGSLETTSDRAKGWVRYNAKNDGKYVPYILSAEDYSR